MKKYIIQNKKGINENKIRERITQVLDTVERIGNKYNVDFYSALVENEDELTISTTKDKLNVKEYNSFGIGIRVIHKNKQGFVSLQKDDKKSIKEAFEKAVKLAKINENSISFVFDKPIKRNFIYKNKKYIDLEKKARIIDKTVKYIDEKNAESLNIENVYRETIDIRAFLSSEGKRLYQEIPYTSFGSKVILKEKRKEIGISKIGKQKGFEIIDHSEKIVRNAYSIAKKLQGAIIPKGGKYKVITDGVLTSVMIHEALGHACESDLVLQNDSCLKGKLGKRLSNANLTVFDNPRKKYVWGSYYFDDEGIVGKKVSLLKKGILNEFLTSRTTAKELNLKLNGHGRSQDFSYLPLVRMSNTYIKKGDMSFDEMKETIKNGLYLKGSLGGQVNTLEGSFVFNSYYGYIIEKGKITKIVKNVSLSSNILNVLKQIIGIGKRYEEDFPGTCGKSGQGVPVSGDNPKLAINNVLIGGK